jgi:hypothetical protein
LKADENSLKRASLPLQRAARGWHIHNPDRTAVGFPRLDTRNLAGKATAQERVTAGRSRLMSSQ